MSIRLINAFSACRLGVSTPVGGSSGLRNADPANRSGRVGKCCRFERRSVVALTAARETTRHARERTWVAATDAARSWVDPGYQSGSEPMHEGDGEAYCGLGLVPRDVSNCPIGARMSLLVMPEGL